MKKDNKNILIIGVIAIIVGLVLYFLCSKQDVYKFDFFDGYTPGTTYKGEINLTNGKVDYKIIPGCSLLNTEECPSDTIVKGTLNKEQLELVKKAFEENNRKDNNWLLAGVSYLIQGDKICNEETNETCEEAGRQMINSINQD